ncbi:MAG: DsbE family thiol:disulfide interchange protein [Gammaproteobacteria bacterium]
MKIFLKIIPQMLLGVVAYVFFKGINVTSEELPSTLINKPFPSFNKPLLENINETVNEKIFLGHMSLLNVFASWCVYCAIEHSMLIAIANDGVIIYGLDYKDDRKSAIAYLKRNGNPYKKVIFDDTNSLAIDLGVYGTPETYVVNEKGIIVYRYTGVITKSVWSKRLAKFFEKKCKR